MPRSCPLRRPTVTRLFYGSLAVLPLAAASAAPSRPNLDTKKFSFAVDVKLADAD